MALLLSVDKDQISVCILLACTLVLLSLHTQPLFLLSLMFKLHYITFCCVQSSGAVTNIMKQKEQKIKHDEYVLEQEPVALKQSEWCTYMCTALNGEIIWVFSLQHGLVYMIPTQLNTTPHSTVQHSTMQCSTGQHSSAQCNTAQRGNCEQAAP